MNTDQQISRNLNPYHYIYAFIGYLFVTVVIFLPLFRHYNQAIIGGDVAKIDGWQNVWNIWWVHKAILSGNNPFFSSYLYHPQGIDLRVQTLNISNALMVIPITHVWGPVAGYNTALIIAFILTGIGAYAFAFNLSTHHIGAWITGLLITFGPYHVTKAWDGQLELIAMQWIMFYALSLLKTVQNPTILKANVSGGLLALIGYTSWYYLLFCAIYSVIFTILWMLHQREWKYVLVASLIVSMSGAVLLMPILVPALRSTAHTVATIDVHDDLDPIIIHSANVNDLFLPNALHPIWGSTITRLGQEWHPYIYGWNISLGITALGLGMIGLLRHWKKLWYWGIIAIAGMVLALGPVLQYGNHVTTLYLPYKLLFNLPGVSIARRPSHFIVLTIIAMTPLIAVGIQTIVQQCTSKLQRLALAIIIVLLITEYFPPSWQILPSQANPAYLQIQETGAVFEIPPPTESSIALQAQIIHKQPLVGGFVSRTPDYPLVNYVYGIYQLWHGTQKYPFVRDKHQTQTDVIANAYGIRTIVVHWDKLTDEQSITVRALLNNLLPQRRTRVQTDHLSIFEIPSTEPQVVMSLGLGWDDYEHDEQHAWQWMAEEGSLRIYNPYPEEQPVAVSLNLLSYAQPRTTQLRIDQHILGSFIVETTRQSYTFHILVPSGEHVLSLNATAQNDSASNRPLSIAIYGYALR